MTPRGLHDLVAMARRALPPGLAFGIADPRDPQDDLRPAERNAMARAVPKRRAEFAAGRRAARAAMTELQMPITAIPMGPDRAPIWPGGITGSLSHSDTACIAVLGRATDFAMIGADLEADDPLAPDLWNEVCSPQERALCDTDPGLAARRIFSAKEASFKAQYPHSLSLLDFADLQVLSLGQDRFAARLARDLPGLAAGTRLDGWQFAASGMILSLVAVPQGG